MRQRIETSIQSSALKKSEGRAMHSMTDSNIIQCSLCFKRYTSRKIKDGKNNRTSCPECKHYNRSSCRVEGYISSLDPIPRKSTAASQQIATTCVMCCNSCSQKYISNPHMNMFSKCSQCEEINPNKHKRHETITTIMRFSKVCKKRIMSIFTTSKYTGVK